VFVLCLQDCAAVILYNSETATQVALDAIQILGELRLLMCKLYTFDASMLLIEGLCERTEYVPQL